VRTGAQRGSGRGGRRRLRGGAWAVGALGGLAVGAGAFLTRPFPPPAPVTHLPLDPSIYLDRGGAPPLSPFHLAVDPMDRLILVNFERDPDRVYLGFEPQGFDDDVHGRGLLVIGWRVDGRVDVFHDASLALSEETYGIAGGGLNAMVVRDFGAGHLALGPGGADVDLAFDDLEGRAVQLRIRETDPRPRRPFDLLAPMGSAATDPPALPLVYLHDFDFVRRAGTEVRIEIDGRAHTPDPLPVPMNGARVHFLRYSPDPFIVTWNPAGARRLDPLGPLVSVAAGGGDSDRTAEVVQGGVRYLLKENEGHFEIHEMSRAHAGPRGVRTVRVAFFPAFPDVAALRPGVEVAGAFRISASPGVGVVTGNWRVARRGAQIRIEVEPSGGWTPNESGRIVRLMYRLVPVFRDWPATYRWTGVMTAPDAHPGSGSMQNPELSSSWERLP
jgi:hypothetical protein